MLEIIIRNMVVVACLYGGYQLAKMKFNDDQKVLRLIIAFILAVILFGIANTLLSKVFGFGKMNIDAEMQKIDVYQVLKKKHPDEYKQMVSELEVMSDNTKMTKEALVVQAQIKTRAIFEENLKQAGNNSRSKYTSALIRQIEELKSTGDSLCYDVMFNPSAVQAAQINSLNNAAKVSGMKDAMIAVFSDDGIDKTTESKEKTDSMALEVQNHLFKNFGTSYQWLLSPSLVASNEDKRKVCDIAIDYYKYLNDPNDRTKMSVLKLSFPEIQAIARANPGFIKP